MFKPSNETFWVRAVLGTNEEGKPNSYVHFTVKAKNINDARDAVETHAAQHLTPLLPSIKFWLIGDRTIWADPLADINNEMTRFPAA